MRTELDKQMSPVWRRAVAAEELRKSERLATLGEKVLALELKIRGRRAARRMALRMGKPWPPVNPLIANLERRGILKGGK